MIIRFPRLLNPEVDYEKFANTYISRKMKEYLKLNLTENRLKLLTDYINNNLNIPLSCWEILKLAIENLSVDYSGDDVIIKIDRNMYIPGSKHLLISVIKLIDNGNLEVPGLHILTNLQYEILKNIHTSVGVYTMTGGSKRWQ